MLAFRDPHHFPAGQLHHFRDTWISIASQTDCDTPKEVLGWIEAAAMSSNIFDIFVGPSKERTLTVTCPLAGFFRVIYLLNSFPLSFLVVF